MLLTTLSEAEAPDVARELIRRTETERAPANKGAIIELVKTIIVYKFANLSRVEIEAMLGLSLQETRVYREASAEGEQRGELRGEQRGEQRGRQAEASRLILRQLSRRLRQELSEPTQSQITALPLASLEQLSEDLLDFEQLEDLNKWLQEHLKTVRL
jgi:predicted transposase YdaD